VPVVQVASGPDEQSYFASEERTRTRRRRGDKGRNLVHVFEFLAQILIARLEVWSYNSQWFAPCRGRPRCSARFCSRRPRATGRKTRRRWPAGAFRGWSPRQRVRSTPPPQTSCWTWLRASRLLADWARRGRACVRYRTCSRRIRLRRSRFYGWTQVAAEDRRARAVHAVQQRRPDFS
jgi:hypothetical protein